jgi:hypothetical protein
VLTVGMLAGWVGISHADVYLGTAKYEKTAPIKSAEDAVSSIPLLKKIPTSFFIGDGFKLKLNGQALRIDHMGTRSVSPAHKRNCLISLSYTTPVAFFGSQIELPLFFSETPVHSKWSANTPGDYVVHLSKDADVDHPILGLQISAKF